MLHDARVSLAPQRGHGVFMFLSIMFAGIWSETGGVLCFPLLTMTSKWKATLRNPVNRWGSPHYGILGYHGNAHDRSDGFELPHS